jgi:hypothetical protein
MRNNNVLLLLIPWWEHKHHRGQVTGTGTEAKPWRASGSPVEYGQCLRAD